jgi:hypothetical protein
MTDFEITAFDIVIDIFRLSRVFFVYYHAIA